MERGLLLCYKLILRNKSISDFFFVFWYFQIKTFCYVVCYSIRQKKSIFSEKRKHFLYLCNFLLYFWIIDVGNRIDIYNQEVAFIYTLITCFEPWQLPWEHIAQLIFIMCLWPRCYSHDIYPLWWLKAIFPSKFICWINSLI